MPQYWILKSEPEAFSFDQLLKEGFTHWDGVRNFQARNNLKAMKKGDLALIYHSVSEKAVVGLAKIAKEHYPDPTDETGKWVAVRVEPVCKLNQPVELATIKEHETLSEIPLIKQSRLSVVPLDEKAFKTLLQLAKTTKY